MGLSLPSARAKGRGHRGTWGYWVNAGPSEQAQEGGWLSGQGTHLPAGEAPSSSPSPTWDESGEEPCSLSVSPSVCLLPPE